MHRIPPHVIQQRLPLIMAPPAMLKTRAREEYPYKLEYRKGAIPPSPPPPFRLGPRLDLEEEREREGERARQADVSHHTLPRHPLG